MTKKRFLGEMGRLQTLPQEYRVVTCPGNYLTQHHFPGIFHWVEYLVVEMEYGQAGGRGEMAKYLLRR